MPEEVIAKPTISRRTCLIYGTVAVVCGALIGLLILTVISGPPPGPIRVRYFNGLDSTGVKVKIRAYANEDGSGDMKEVAFEQTADLQGRSYQYDELDDKDYKLFRVYVADTAGNYDEQIPTFEFKAKEAAKADGHKLHEIFVSRRTDDHKHHVVVTYGGEAEEFASHSVRKEQN